MKKRVIGILAIIMVLAIAGAASAHDKWTAISDAERKLLEAGYRYLSHEDMKPEEGLPTVLLTGGLDVGDELCGYTVTFINTVDPTPGGKVEETLKKLGIEIDKIHEPAVVEGLHQITITVRYMKIGAKNVPVMIVERLSGNWAREIK